MNTANTYRVLFLWTVSISLILGIGLGYLGNRSISEKDQLADVKKRLGIEIEKFKSELDDLGSILNSTNSRNHFERISDKLSYPFYLFEQGRTTYWSDNHFVPQYQDISGEQNLEFIELREGQFVVVKNTLSGVNRQLVGLIPIYKNSQIDNQHLESSVNTNIFANNALGISKYENDQSDLKVCINNQCLFYVSFSENYVARNDTLLILSFFLICISILSLILLGTNLLMGVEFNVKGVLIFSGFLLALRMSMLLLGFPQKLIISRLFDPKLFASSVFNASLGDMFLNVLFLLFFVIALLGWTKRDLLFLSSFTKLAKYVSTGLLVVLSQLALFLQFLVIQTLYSNSRYSLDITQSINFSYDRALAYAVLVMSTMLFFIFSHFCYNLIIRINKNSIKQMWLVYGGGTIVFLLCLIALNHPLLTILLSVIYFVIIRSFDFLRNFEQINYFSFIYIFCGILISTLLCTYSMDYFENERIQENKEKFATHFLIGNDILAEYLLADAIKNIGNDAFIKSRMFSPFVSNKNSIKEKVKKIFLNKYFDRYDVEIKLYNSKGDFYGEGSEDNYSKFKASFDSQSKSAYKDLFYINKLDANVPKRYVGFVEIENYGLVTGYVVMDLNLKKIIPDNVYPELLVDSRFLLPFENKDYNYAIYHQGQLLSHSGDFDYQNNFDAHYLNKDKIAKNGFSHLIVEDHEGRKIVVSSKEYSWYNIASNFSFLVLILMFVVVLILMVYAIFFYVSGKSLNYSARIQLYFNLAFFLPLFAVSVTTVSLVTASYKEEVEHEHFKKALLISHNLEESLKEYSKDNDHGKLENSLASIASFSSADANLFDIHGKMVVTSQPLIYKKAVLSPYLATHAMSTIISESQNHLTIGEKVGNLEYNTTYVAIKENNTGELMGVLSVPYFESEYKLEKEKIEVFTTILNIFTLVFIVFLVISYFASKWLTFPLLFITQKLKETTLSEKNEPLQWNSSDEIGLMVSEYNKMVVNLEDSKKALARTQKESAWREIAQQVAHEIKNPITPMKLTLQHLKRTLGERSDNDNIQKPVNTLLSQVDTLSEIATSFSSFAKMPIPEQEEYELTKIIRETVALYENHATDKILLELSHGDIYTIGDEQLMGRILSNIIINAKQSVGEEVIQVLVKLEEKENNKLMITIKDNGLGIAEEIREKVFIPNFTTKTSGSGIGLAIAKHGIEHSGGKIWFESITNRGTTFFIELVKSN